MAVDDTIRNEASWRCGELVVTTHVGSAEKIAVTLQLAPFEVRFGNEYEILLANGALNA
jgi:hypothetical protein